MAAPNPFRRLETEEINALPLKKYQGPIHLVQNGKDWQAAFHSLRDESILGFDTETRPSFTKGVSNSPALLQLATASAVYLIPLHRFSFNKECADLLADPAKIKAGVAIQDDMNALAKLRYFSPAGLVDLGQLAATLGLPNHGLRTLAASLFGWRIAKGAQCSNWNAPTLSQNQIIYAATDAWLSRLIYLSLMDPDFPRISVKT